MAPFLRHPQGVLSIVSVQSSWLVLIVLISLATTPSLAKTLHLILF
jgi:hypothetical protein